MDTRSRNVEIKAGNIQMPAFISEPAVEGIFPGVLLMMEAYGLTEHTKEVGQKLAERGFVVVAPNLYERAYPSTVFTYAERPKAMEAMNSVNLNETVEDARSALEYIRSQPNVSTVGTVGLCFGGALVMPLAATCGNSLKAAASFYGHCDGKWLGSPESITAPLMFFYGANDSVTPPQEVDDLERKLVALGKTFEIRRYDNAGHAYMNFRRSDFSADAAEKSLNDLAGFLNRYLGRPQLTARRSTQSANDSRALAV